MNSPDEKVTGYMHTTPNANKWTLGKTHASIKFAQDAEKLITNLRAKIDNIKTGREVLNDWLNIEDYVMDFYISN